MDMLLLSDSNMMCPQVKDVIRQVNGRKVSSLKAFGSVVRDSPCEVVCLDLIRGSGSSNKHLTLYSRIRPHDESVTEDEKKISQESLKEIYCSTQGSEKVYHLCLGAVKVDHT